jgi:hypothetical protein
VLESSSPTPLFGGGLFANSARVIVHQLLMQQRELKEFDRFSAVSEMYSFKGHCFSNLQRQKQFGCSE